MIVLLLWRVSVTGPCCNRSQLTVRSLYLPVQTNTKPCTAYRLFLAVPAYTVRPIASRIEELCGWWFKVIKTFQPQGEPKLPDNSGSNRIKHRSSALQMNILLALFPALSLVARGSSAHDVGGAVEWTWARYAYQPPRALSALRRFTTALKEL